MSSQQVLFSRLFQYLASWHQKLKFGGIYALSLYIFKSWEVTDDHSSQLLRHQSGYSILWGSDTHYFLLLFYYCLFLVFEGHTLLPTWLMIASNTNRTKEGNALQRCYHWIGKDMSDKKGKTLQGKSRGGRPTRAEKNIVVFNSGKTKRWTVRLQSKERKIKVSEVSDLVKGGLV